MRRAVYLSEVSGERLPLRRCQHVADIAQELHDALGALVREL